MTSAFQPEVATSGKGDALQSGSTFQDLADHATFTPVGQ
jgi:hypothetical protein